MSRQSVQVWHIANGTLGTELEHIHVTNKYMSMLIKAECGHYCMNYTENRAQKI